MPFGLCSAPAHFQNAIDQILCGLPGTIAYLDDVLISASSREEGLQRLGKVLQRLEEYGVRVNENKCEFLQPSIDYLGHTISAAGLQPQESNLAALRDAPEPGNKEELRAYLGLINYYHNFIPNLSAKLSCFYDLLNKDTLWLWSKECAETFKESKSWVLKSSLLVHYDVKKPIVLTCDASMRGVGAVLSHLIDGQERPIAFASKTLSKSERNYAQLHREALALVFGIKKFHKYIYGRKCILQTDHQPLETIFGPKRGVPSMAAARLQRWALLMSAYDLEVKYRRAADVPHADGLSRLPLPDMEPVEMEANFVSHTEACVEVMSNYCAVSDVPSVTSIDIGRLTDRDPILSKVKDFIMCGWRNNMDPELKVFYAKKDELSIDQNCILWGSRVVIPIKLQPSVLRMLHDQHPGITRMKMLARSYVWWQGLDKAIEDVVASCEICQATRNAASKVPLRPWSVASFRWQRVHIDHAEDPESRKQFLVVVDSFSRWLEVFVTNSTSSQSTIERLRTLFSAYGLPGELVSDNATGFSSFEFRQFLSQNNIKFTLSPPYHPASNGTAERSVQEVKKNLLRQVLEGHQKSQSISLQHKIDNFLFAYRNTPNTVTGQTPAELFLNWKPRTRLSLLKPNLQETLQRKKQKQKEVADRHRGMERYFVDGQLVYVKTVRNEKVSWVPGKVLVRRSPVTYLISIDGKTRFCHADHLRPQSSQDVEEEVASGPTAAAGSRPNPSFCPIISASHQKSSQPSPAESQTPEKAVVSLPRASMSPRVAEAQHSPPPLSLRKSSRAVKKPERLNL